MSSTYNDGVLAVYTLFKIAAPRLIKGKVMTTARGVTPLPVPKGGGTPTAVAKRAPPPDPKAVPHRLVPAGPTASRVVRPGDPLWDVGKPRK